MKLLQFNHVSGLITQNLKPGPLFYIILLNSTHFSASIALSITKIGLKLQEIQLKVRGGFQLDPKETKFLILQVVSLVTSFFLLCVLWFLLWRAQAEPSELTSPKLSDFDSSFSSSLYIGVVGSLSLGGFSFSLTPTAVPIFISLNSIICNCEEPVLQLQDNHCLTAFVFFQKHGVLE